MGERAVDIALAILQGAVAIAGLTLVYSAFLVARASEFKGSIQGDRYLLASRLSLIPVLAALGCSWRAVRVIMPGHWGSAWATSWLPFVFEILLAITAIYAIIAAILST